MSAENCPSRYWRLKSARSTLYATKGEVEIFKNNPGLHTEQVIITPNQSFPPKDQSFYEFDEKGNFTRPSFEPKPGSTQK